MEIGVLGPAGTIEVSIAREEFRHGFFHLSAQRGGRMDSRTKRGLFHVPFKYDQNELDET